MSTPASVKGHPIHPMLVALPIGLWVFSIVCDIVFHAGWGGPTWKVVAWYTIAGGVVGALLSAVPILQPGAARPRIVFDPVAVDPRAALREVASGHWAAV